MPFGQEPGNYNKGWLVMYSGIMDDNDLLASPPTWSNRLAGRGRAMALFECRPLP
jgi:hypothetical protein